MTAKRKKKKAKPVKAGSSSAIAAKPASARASSNLAAILASAAAHADDGDFDAAAADYSRASALAPKNVAVFDGWGDALIEAGRPDEAAPVLRRAIARAPGARFERYMDLAQVLGCTMEAVDVSREGIQVLRRERAGVGVERAKELAVFEVSALCGMAECLLGVIEESNDQAVADRFDGEVEKIVGEALALCCEGSVGEIEAALALANLRLSQGRAAEARVAMERVVGGMRDGLDVLESEGGDADSGEHVVKGLEMLPPMEMRIAVGKQLVEVQMWAEAVAVLSSTLHECDFNVEVWYMLVAAFYSADEKEQAKAALENLKNILASPDGFAGKLEDEAVGQLEALLGKKHTFGGAGSVNDKMED